MSLLSISTESVLKQVYALSALRSHLTATPSVLQPFLTEDNRAGLIPVLNEALSYIAVDLLRHLQVITPSAGLNDLIEIEADIVNLPAGTDKIVESAIAQRMLQILYAPVSESAAQQYASMATNTTGQLLNLFRELAISAAPAALRWNGY